MFTAKRVLKMRLVKLITTIIFLSFFSIVNAQSKLKNMKRGVEYNYFTDKNHQDTEKEIYITKEDYKYLCENTRGITKFMSRTPGNGNSDYGYLIENGDFDGWKVTYDSAYDKKECRIEMTASGFIKGNSRRVTVRGYVSTFITSEEGLILAHWGTAY
jgi:hypothetical protein